MTRLQVAASVILLGWIGGAQAAPLAIGEMSITGGSFFQTDWAAPIPFSTIGPNTNLVVGYLGSGGVGRAAADPDPDRILGFEFGPPLLPVNVYTADANLGDTNSPPGTIPGGPVPSGVLDPAAGTIVMDLSSWFVNWNDDDFDEGHLAAIGSWDTVTHAYSLTWEVIPTPGIFISHIWTLQGVAHPVPEPASLGFVGIALVALARLRRRYA